MVYDKNFWDNKWTKSPIVYGGRTLRNPNDKLVIDVRNFITWNDSLLDQVVKTYSLKRQNINSTALAVQKFVVKFLTYKYDEEANQCPEFWQFPFETLQSQVGDCEDGAILTASLCIAAGIPNYRIKVAAGEVQEAPTAPTGGHAYCIFLADRLETERKMDWTILDWCFFEDSTWPIEKKPLAKDGGYNKSYKDVWFTFNNEHSWNQTALSIEAGRVSQDGAVVQAINEEQSYISKMMAEIQAKIDE